VPIFRDARGHFGFSREGVLEALHALAVTTKKRPIDGEVFAFLPDNLYAIWWAEIRRAAWGNRLASTGGNAA
jgi:hypothetical protein